MVNEKGLYDFTISVQEKEGCLSIISKILEQSLEGGEETHPAIIAMGTLAEKLLDTMEEDDLKDLTKEEIIALNAVDVLIGSILTGKDPMELAKERYGK
jgi:hypothetical protein